jgi:hypothetical protein
VLRERTAGDPRVVFAMIAVGFVPSFLTLRTVVAPGNLVISSADPTPLGYTWSLSLWLVPALAILAWLQLHPRYLIPRRAFWVTVGLLASLGVVLDLVFGNTFFTFPNKGAVLGIYVWGLDLNTGTLVKDIPIEEFGFYLFGIAAALLLYLWSDIFWFNRYVRLEDLRLVRRPPKLKLHWPSALIGLGLVVAAILYKKLLSGSPEGFPGYFTFLVAVAFIPSCLLFQSVRGLINWHCFSFMALAMFALSMLWEATVAFPYQWWGYKPEQMIGIFIGAWDGLPVEEPFLWLLVSFATVSIFEAIHVEVATRAGLPAGQP